MDVSGSYQPAFSQVVEEFGAGIQAGVDVGAALAVHVDCELVVDVWAGHADQGRTMPWQRDTICPILSGGKAWLALGVMTLVESGQLELRRPVADYWPEFAQAGKGAVTVEHVLTHRAGVPFHAALPAGEDWTRHANLARVLERQAPLWLSLDVPAYHPLVMGTLIDAIVRRVTGETAAAYFERVVANPRGIEASFGLVEHLRPRRAELGSSPLESIPITDGCAPDPRCAPTPEEPRRTYALVNSPRFETSEWPSINGMATARGLAGVYAAAISGELVGAVTLAEMTTLRWAECERTGGQLMRMGLGVNLGHTDSYWYGPSDSAFGHVGKGGSTGFADPARRLAVGYVTNSHYEGPGSGPRSQKLARAIDAALAASG
jgi:CubicO group peptidase (beta-lactamase class C family)